MRVSRPVYDGRKCRRGAPECHQREMLGLIFQLRVLHPLMRESAPGLDWAGKW